MRAIQNSRADLLQKDVGRYLKQEVPDEEQASAQSEGGFTQTKRLVHVQLGEANIDAIEIGDEITQDQKRNKPPHNLADHALLDLFHGRASRSWFKAHSEIRTCFWGNYDGRG